MGFFLCPILFQIFSVPWPKSNQTLDLRKIKQECYCPIILHRNDMDGTFSDETPPELSSCLFWEGWCSLQGVVNEARYWSICRGKAVSRNCCCLFQRRTYREAEKFRRTWCYICWSVTVPWDKRIWKYFSSTILWGFLFFSIKYIPGLWDSLKSILSLPKLCFLGIGIMLLWPGVVCPGAVCFRDCGEGLGAGEGLQCWWCSLVLCPLPCASLLIIHSEHALRALVRMCLIKITCQGWDGD